MINQQDGDTSINNSVAHQNIKLEAELKVTSSSELIAKNTYLKNLYFIGFNSKPVNKAVLNAIDLEEAVNSIKSYISTDDLSMKSCGSLVLGLCKIYEKKIKLYHEDLEVILKLNKDKKALKAEKEQKEEKSKAQKDRNIEIENERNNQEMIKKKLKNKGESGKNNNLSEADLFNNENLNTNIVNNMSNNHNNNPFDSNYDEMFLSTNINLNTNSKSIRDFTMAIADNQNNKSKKPFNLYDISSLNSAIDKSLSKLKFDDFDKLETPVNLFNQQYPHSTSKYDMLRANNNPSNSKMSGDKNNLNSNSKLLNSENQFLNGLVDKSNMEDEIFNRNFNNFFKIVSDEKINFNNFENPQNQLDYNDNNELNYNDENNNLNDEEFLKFDNLQQENNKNVLLPKKLVFSQLKSKMEVDEDNSQEMQEAFDSSLFANTTVKKYLKRKKYKKVTLEVDDQVYLKFELPKKNEEKKSAKYSHINKLHKEKLDLKSPDYLLLYNKVTD